MTDTARDSRPDVRPPDMRPLSPHLQIWRWHATMAASILHRATGVALYGAAALLVVWLVLVASGPSAYALADVVFDHWLGQLCLYGVVAAIAYHAANGVRHLLWDVGTHLNPKHAEVSAWFAFLVAVAAPTALFAWFFFVEGA